MDYMTNFMGVVTSLAEVWIEIDFYKVQDILDEVTSLAEVWIEMFVHLFKPYAYQSLPLRKCGLKLSRKT